MSSKLLSLVAASSMTALVAVGCTTAESPGESGTPDAAVPTESGAPDASAGGSEGSTEDSNAPEAGTGDATTDDSSTSDASAGDSGTSDARATSPNDATAGDSSASDAGLGDSSGGNDSGDLDARGDSAAKPPRSDAGVSCASRDGAISNTADAGTAHQILVSDDGVALVSTPTISRLSAVVKVSDTLQQATSWLATSDQPWLTVTPSGLAGDNLVLTASPAGLSVDAIQYATVTLCSDDPTVGHTDVVRVGFWVGSKAPAATASIAGNFTELATDPIRPYAYVHSGGTDITVYNTYTTEIVTTIKSVGAQLGRMAPSTDGSRLFVVDATNFAIIPIDLDTHSVGSSWPLTTSTSAYLACTRTAGTPLLFSGDGTVYDAVTGTRFGATFDAGYYGNDVVAASQDGSRLCTVDVGLSPYSLSCYSLAFGSSQDRPLIIGPGHSVSGSGANGQVGSNGQDLALNADGSRVYVASGAPYVFTAFDATSSSLPVVQSLPGDAYPNNIEIMSDGRILAGANVLYGSKDVWVYTAQGVLVVDDHVAGYAHGLLPGQLKATGDALRFVALTDDPLLAFFTVGP